MPYDLRAALALNGVRVPDRPGDAAIGPVALADLSIRWGRESSDMQPDPSTCSFSVWNENPTGAGLASLVYAGATVAVYAFGDRTYPDFKAAIDDIQTWPLYSPDSPEPRNHLWPLAGMVGSVVKPGNIVYAHGRATNPSVQQTLVLGGKPFGPPYVNVPLFSDLPRCYFSVSGQFLVGMKFQIRLYSYDLATNTLTPTNVVSTVQTGTGSPSQGIFGPIFDPAGMPGRPAFGVECLAAVSQTWTDTAGAWSAQTKTWSQLPMAIIADFLVRNFNFPPASGGTVPITAEYWVPVFRGRVTDVEITPDEGASVLANATAVDVQAEYAHRYIGDEPWLAETATVRSNRITDLAHISRIPVPTPTDAWQISWRDVDSQSTIELLQSLAVSMGCVLWLRTGWTDQTLYYENPSNRSALLQLKYDPDAALVVISPNPNQPATIALSACDILREPTAVRQDTENIVSVVDLTWLEQTLNEDNQPQPTERHVTVSDDAATAAYGTRRLGISTELANGANANTIANDALIRSREARWLIPSLVWDAATGEETASVESLFSLLDGTARIAAPLALSELPPWSPIGSDLVCWIEGGQYAYDGSWTLTLSVAPASSGGQSVTWQSLKNSASLSGYGWNAYDPAIDWRDLVGVAAPTS
jgi:hypothetical protein